MNTDDQGPPGGPTADTGPAAWGSTLQGDARTHCPTAPTAPLDHQHPLSQRGPECTPSTPRPTPLSLSHRQEVSRLLTRNKRREAGGGEAWSREWEGTAQGEVCNSSKVLLQDQLSVVVWFSFLGLPNKTPQTWGLKQQKFTLSCETGGPKSMCPGTTLPPKAPGGTPCFPRPASRGGWQPGNLCLWPNHTSLCLHYQMDFPSVYLYLALLLLPYKDLALD